MSKIVSGRVKTPSPLGIRSDRYEFLGLDQAEPNLGDPLVGPSSIGANPIKVGSFYQLSAIGEYPGERYWSTQVGIGTTLGIISVYANGELPNNAFGRIHGLNFVGTGVTVETPSVNFIGDVGIATVRFTVTDILNQGDPGQVLYNGPNGYAIGSTDLNYYNSNFGIGTSQPNSKLEVIGDIFISGVVTATSFVGNLIGTATNSITATNVIGGIASVTSLNVSEVSTLGFITATDAFYTGVVTATTFYGTLDGVVNSALYAISSGVSTNVIGGIASVTNLNVSGVSTLGFITATDAFYTGVVTATTFYGNLIGIVDYATRAGIATYATSAGIATYATNAGIATYATSAGISTYSGIAGIATYATSAGIATYASTSGVSTVSQGLTGVPNITVGIATANEYYGVFKGTLDSGVIIDKAGYASTAGIATYATSAGIATYSSIAGIATYSTNAGIATYASTAGISTYASTAGIATYATNAGIATYATRAGIATYASTAGIATYATNAGIATYASTSGVSTVSQGLTGTPNLNVGIVTANEYYGVFKGTLDSGVILDKANYANFSGIATYSSIAGIATYATNAGISTYATRAGIATVSEGLTGTPNINVGISTATEYYGVFKGTLDSGVILDKANYANFSGIATYASTAGIATYATLAGIATYASTSGIATVSQGLTGVPNITVGIATANEYYGVFKGTIDSGVILDKADYANFAGIATYATNSGVSTALQYSRTFEIIGDVVASPIFFDGTGNVSLAATIQPNSVGLGTDTFGDYVKDITGTANQITVTTGTGEGSSSTLSIPNQFTTPQDVTVSRDLQVNRNLNVNGNIMIGGTSATLFTETLKVSDSDIVLGIRTDGNGNDISTDNTANHGGIAIASTEGNPLVILANAGVGETLPATYKKIMWFKEGSFAGLGTDAWLSNYAIGIGSTQFPSGTRLASGSVQFTENDLAVVRNINASGIITATSFVGSFQGNVTTANYATNSGISTNLKGGVTGNIPYQLNPGITTFVNNSSATPNQVLLWNGTVPVWSNVSTGSLVGVVTYADRAGIATNVIGGIASVTSLNVTGISTLGTLRISSGIVTATSGIVTYYGDGSQLTGIVAGSSGVSISTNTTNQSQFIPYATSIGTTTGLGVTTGGLVFNPSTTRLGIGTTNPISNLDVRGNVSIASTLGIGTVIDIVPYDNLNSGTLSWEGSAGQLFSITNNLTTGSIYSVNDVSGIPSIDVNANGTIQLGPYGGNIGLGTTTPTSKLTVVGDVLVSGVLTASRIVGTSLSITGISTIANFRITNVGTGATVGGIGVTYYGDGSRLTGIIGIATEGGIVGTGVTLLDFRGSGISTVTISSGIATINITDGGLATPDISPVMMGMIF